MNRSTPGLPVHHQLPYIGEGNGNPLQCVLAWRIPGTGEPGGLPSMGSHSLGHDWSDLAARVSEADQQHTWSSTRWRSAPHMYNHSQHLIQTLGNWQSRHPWNRDHKQQLYWSGSSGLRITSPPVSVTTQICSVCACPNCLHILALNRTANPI